MEQTRRRPHETTHGKRKHTRTQASAPPLAAVDVGNLFCLAPTCGNVTRGWRQASGSEYETRMQRCRTLVIAADALTSPAVFCATLCCAELGAALFRTSASLARAKAELRNVQVPVATRQVMHVTLLAVGAVVKFGRITLSRELLLAMELSSHYH